jgi:hypothetical protein
MASARKLRGAAGGLLALTIGVMAGTAPVASARTVRAASAASLARTAGPGRASSTQHVAAPRYKYSWSSIAWTGSHAVVAATDAHGDLYYFWLAGTTWHSQRVARGKRGVAYSKPAIAWTGHTVAIVALSESGGLVYFARHTSNSGWSSRLLSQVAHHRYGAPSVTAIPGGGVLASASNSAGELMSFELAPGKARWTITRASAGTFGMPSVAVAYDSMTLTYLGLITATSSSTLYFWWEPLGSTESSWSRETIASLAPGSSFNGASIAATAGSVLVTAAATSGEVNVWSDEIGSPAWSSPQTVVAAGGIRYSHPEIAWTGPVSAGSDSYDVVTATSQHGELDYWWAPDGVNGWTREVIAASGRQIGYANPGLAITATSVIITAVNSKPGDVWYWDQPFTTTGWQRLRVATG